MKLTIVSTTRFRKEFRKAVKRGLDVKTFEEVVETLAEQRPLPQKNRDHALGGNFKGFRECHIQPDWLLIYKVYGGELILSLERTGTHSDLFKK